MSASERRACSIPGTNRSVIRDRHRRIDGGAARAYRIRRDATSLDRRFSRIRVVDPHHPLYGECYPVCDRRPGRGPGLIVIRLPDGRERTIARSATAQASTAEGAAQVTSRPEHISVRTLLPLANHVRAVLASRHADPESDGGGDSAEPTAAHGTAARRTATPVAPAPGRDAAPTGAAGRSAGAAPTSSVGPTERGGSC